MNKFISSVGIRIFALITLVSFSTPAVEAQSGDNTAQPCPVEISSDIVNGTVTVDKTEAMAGETVTVTVTPAYGYAATSRDVNIELTIDPGFSHAPSRIPVPGESFHPTGDARATHDVPATYSFTMPEYPLSVLISANFSQLPIYGVYWVHGKTGHSLYLSTSNGEYWGGGIPEGTLVTVTIRMNKPEDFFVEGILVTDNNNWDNTVETTYLGNGIYTFTMPAFEIYVSGIEKAYLHGVRFDDNNHWATYYGDYVLKVPDGVQGYVVTGVTDTEVQLEILYDGDNSNGENPPFIPWKMGVLLYSETPMDEVVTSISSRASWDYTSMLNGSLVDMEMPAGYVLYGDKFYLSRPGTLPAHRCYLPLDSVQAASAPRVLNIRRPGEGVATGIKDVKADNANDVAGVKYVSITGAVSDTPFSGVNVMVITRADGTTEKHKIIMP